MEFKLANSLNLENYNILNVLTADELPTLNPM